MFYSLIIKLKSFFVSPDNYLKNGYSGKNRRKSVRNCSFSFLKH